MLQPLDPDLELPGHGAEESVIASDLCIRGGLEVRGLLQLRGAFVGEIKVEHLVLAETAVLEGSVEALTVEIHGRVTGAIRSREVRLGATAKIEADIAYEQLTVEPGARIHGRLTVQTARDRLHLVGRDSPAG